MSWAKMMPATTRLLEMAEQGEISWEALTRDLLSWLGEADAREFAQSIWVASDEFDSEGDD